MSKATCTAGGQWLQSCSASSREIATKVAWALVGLQHRVGGKKRPNSIVWPEVALAAARKVDIDYFEINSEEESALKDTSGTRTELER